MTTDLADRKAVIAEAQEQIRLLIGSGVPADSWKVSAVLARVYWAGRASAA